MSKTITAFFGPGQRSVKTDPLFQWDDGVILKFSGLNLPNTYAVDFSNSTSGGTKKRNTGNSDGVLVPAEVFTSGTEIYAWPVGTDEIGSHTEAVVIIPLDRRARPAGALPPGPQDDDARTIITEAVNAWMDAHAGEMGGGISEAIKNALLQLAEHVAYIDEHGQDYYDDLDAALNYVKELTAISAQFSQGEAVIYDTDTLDTMRRYLAVVAQYNDSTSELVTNYTLSGVLQSGTSSITAAYEGKTDSFDVQVTHYEADLSSITATYTQSGTVYDTDTIDSLKADLAVTAVYSDSSTQTVPAADYVLSGNLTVGTSTITVSYGGKTTTFNVTVTHGFLYTVDDGALSTVSYCDFTLGSNGTETFSQSGGTHLTQTTGTGGSATLAKFTDFNFENEAHLSMQFKVNDISWMRTNNTADPGNFMVSLYNSTDQNGVCFGCARYGSATAAVKFRPLVNGVTSATDLSVGAWHEVTVDIVGGKQTINLDGTPVLTNANLTTGPGYGFSPTNITLYQGNTNPNNIEIRRIELSVS